MNSLVKDPSRISIAMIGILPDNAHPYSWSAAINGFDQAEMAQCPEPVVFEYLSAEPAENIGIPGVQVTHIWSADADSARQVAKAALIPNVLTNPEDAIGVVDAVIIPTDIGSDHLEMARPFVQAGLPIFIDKPLSDRADHLEQFINWHLQGAHIQSGSVLRFATEFIECGKRMAEVGKLRLVTMTMVKSWERYGMHAAEAVYPFLRPGGWTSVVNTGTEIANIVHVSHEDGVEVVLSLIDDMFGSAGCLGLYGVEGSINSKFCDRYSAVKSQLTSFVSYLKTGIPSVPFSETIEIVRIIIAGSRSRAENGRRVMLSEIGSAGGDFEHV
jgi:Oxidoreductase family, NAD-binding Rossmann fold